MAMRGSVPLYGDTVILALICGMKFGQPRIQVTN
ncbi:hypothetical protein IMAU60055_03162 [Lactiplantibacillus plantarum]|nr:hypothetical protein [Lactiplantibacillus plantarum]